MAEERLQKVLAAAGVASRRASEQLILAGRVAVDGAVVRELGTKVDPAKSSITVDGEPLERPGRHAYFKLHKPRGILSDVGGDTRGRETVLSLLPAEHGRLYPVGRLDLNSEGLVLMTDDGDLAHKLTHPRFEHPKTYYVLVSDRPTAEQLAQLRGGVDLPTGRSAPAYVTVSPRLPTELRLAPGPTKGYWLQIVLREGKKRQIRHMTAAVGLATLRLVRWSIGPLTLGDLAAGSAKPLTRGEVAALRDSLRSGARPVRPAAPPAGPRRRPIAGRGRPVARRTAPDGRDRRRPTKR
jgi:23S rRNA pseudouridine2605 synthase